MPKAPPLPSDAASSTTTSRPSPHPVARPRRSPGPRRRPTLPAPRRQHGSGGCGDRRACVACVRRRRVSPVAIGLLLRARRRRRDVPDEPDASTADSRHVAALTTNETVEPPVTCALGSGLCEMTKPAGHVRQRQRLDLALRPTFPSVASAASVVMLHDVRDRDGRAENRVVVVVDDPADRDRGRVGARRGCWNCSARPWWWSWCSVVLV